MARRSTSTDPRSLRLRARIKEGAKQLVRSRAVDTISLNDLLAEAGVSRQGFYEHFTDRDDAIMHAINDDFADALNAERVKTEEMSKVLPMLAHLIDDQRDTYSNVRGSALFDAVVDQWRELLAPKINALIADSHSIDGPGDNATATFVLGGIIELTRVWLRSTEPVAPDVHAQQVLLQIAEIVGVSALEL